jgi:alkanesulfonate monooxygenase SsuD/methylene tetrahydromethanopterin reductase-like flavin-dependent oxidoreductase (luciferase family)
MAAQSTYRQRVGFNVRRGRATLAIEAIREAEAAGVEAVWMTMSATGADSLTVFAAAAAQTEHIRLGTSIVPAFTRHPLGLATQALALDDIAPGRVRIGVGTSHGPTMRAYGAREGDGLLRHPLAWLGEYVQVARAAIQDGRATFAGQDFTVDAHMPAAVVVPVLISALRPNAWELAGALSDGGISWLCPVDYLLREAKPAMQRGAQRAGRATPPLVAHIPVAFGTERSEVRERARAQFGGYAGLPFYAKMFAASGYPLGPDGAYSDALLDHLVVSGDDAAVAAQLRDLLDQGLDELLVMLVHGEDQRAEEQRLMRLIGRL